MTQDINGSNDKKKSSPATPSTSKEKDTQLWRDLAAYWILGLCNNYGYVVMLSAAHDIIGRFGGEHVSDYSIKKHISCVDITDWCCLWKLTLPIANPSIFTLIYKPRLQIAEMCMCMILLFLYFSVFICRRANMKRRQVRAGCAISYRRGRFCWLIFCRLWS